MEMNFKPDDPISRHFTYHEALWLPSWNRYAMAPDGLTPDVLDRLKKHAEKMDLVRDFFGKPLRVHCWYRPDAYNRAKGGAAHSRHKAEAGTEAATDFDVEGLSCDEGRKLILAAGKLEEWDFRMEDNGPGSPWLHLDSGGVLPGHARYFRP